MVLINGVKYACERCIRGHRVTTCTHTDQPLMVIKPKGRPSTQCPHCKEQRRIKNSHVVCTCGRKHNGKIDQHKDCCPCHVTGECTCSSKKKPLKKHATSQRKTVVTKKQESNVSPLNQTDALIETPISESINSRPMSVSMGSSSNYIDKDIINNSNFYDSANPPIGNDSISSLIPSDIEFKKIINTRQIGMDPLDKFKPLPINLRQKRVGEISVPVAEYVAPMNKMNNHLSALLNTINIDSSPTISPDSNGNDLAPFENNNIDVKLSSSDLYNIPPPTLGNGLLDIFDENIPNHKHYSKQSSTPNDSGLESLFPLFPLIGPSFSQSESSYHANNESEIKNNSLLSNNTGNLDLSQQLQYFDSQSELSFKNLSDHIPNSSSNNYISNNSILPSQSTLLHQATTGNLQSQKIYRNPTGSSTSSSLSHHSYHRSHHHGGSHHHNHISHFQPYANANVNANVNSNSNVNSNANANANLPRRSSSFLSIASTHSVGSSIGSPMGTYERPQLLTAESVESIQQYSGPQLTTSKTNTTLMDDIYQTKTYTESQNGDNKSRKSISSLSEFKNSTNINTPADGLFSDFVDVNVDVASDAVYEDFTSEFVQPVSLVPESTLNGQNYDQDFLDSILNQ
ncbi:Haa1 protein [Martiniozyma asiatica (nom. inval.)]|nr:Haa1 protein [Martiniozyma asiatica]